MQASLHPKAVELTTDEARRGRDGRERELLADLEDARRTMAAVLANEDPARHPRIHAGFRRTYAAYARRDWELNTCLIHPTEYVFKPGELGQTLPDARDRYLGVDGYLEAQLVFIDAWPDLQLGLVEVLDIRPDAVVTLVQFEGRGARSGLELDWRALVEHRFREGLAVDQTFWFDLEAGAAELGLRVPRPPR